LRAFKQRLAKVIDHEFGDAPLFVLKDPRLCKLTPLWLQLLAELDITLLFVIPIRNPLEVAESLKKRNLFDEKKSLLLWLNNFLAAGENTRGFPRTFVLYETLLKDWRSTVAKIGLELNVSWPRQSYATDHEVEKFLSAGLRHHRYDNAEFLENPHVADWIKTAFAWAIQAAEHPPASSEDLDRLRFSQKAAEQVYMPVLVDREIAISTLVDDLRQRTETNRCLTNDNQALTSRIGSQDARIIELQRELQSKETELQSKEAELQSRKNELQTRKAELQNKETEL
jgi:hypothetical protein